MKRPCAHSDGRSCERLLLAGLLVVCPFALSLCAQDFAGAIFEEASTSTGLRFQHFAGITGEYYMPEITGSGVALLDYDLDGDLDVFFIQGNLLSKSEKRLRSQSDPLLGPATKNTLYRNDIVPRGVLSFRDVTTTSNLGGGDYGFGVAVGDYNNDRYPDLYVTTFGSNSLYRNNQDGTFLDVTRKARVDDPRWSTSASFLDYDRDGDLDLYVVNYSDFTVENNKTCRASTGEVDYCGPLSYSPLPDRLFRNDGHDQFTDVSGSAGLLEHPGTGLGVICGDFDSDGWIDIYVANDRMPNFLWLNNQDGTFREAALEFGVAYSAEGVAEAGMGTDAADVNDDGLNEIFVTNLTGETNNLYALSNGAYIDMILSTGMAAPSLPMTGFGARFLDFDNDGLLDLLVANGAVTIIESLRGEEHPYHQRNQLFRNKGQGLRFEDVSSLAGPALALSEVSRGLATGDVDNDGDIDAVVTNNNGGARLLRNRVGSGVRSLQIQLRGVRDNSQGLGAVVVLEREAAPPMWRRVQTDGSYLSASDPRVHFGLGHGTKVQRAVVYWPSGVKESWALHGGESFLTLQQGTGAELR